MGSRIDATVIITCVVPHVIVVQVVNWSVTARVNPATSRGGCVADDDVATHE